MDFSTELTAVLPILIPLIIYLSNGVKGWIPKWARFLIPFVFGIVVFVWLYFAFPEYPLKMYIVNGILFAFASTVSYKASNEWKISLPDLEFGSKDNG